MQKRALHIKIGVTVFLLFTVFVCHAQNSSKLGWFQVNYIKGCAPLKVEAIQTNNFPKDKNRIFWFKDTWQTDSSFTYTQPGIYYVRLFIGSSGDMDSVKVQVFEPSAPDFDVLLCKNRSVSVKIKNPTYDYYYARFTATDSVKVSANEYWAANYTYPSATTQNVKVKGYYTGSQEGCGEKTVSVDIKDNLQAATLTELTGSIQNSTINLTYTLEPNIQYYLEQQLNGQGAFIQLYDITGTTDTVVNNIDLTTGFYTYRIAAFDPCNNEKVNSNLLSSVQVKAQALNNKNTILYQTTALPGQEVFLYKNNTLLQKLEATAGTYEDSLITCNQEYCYEIRVNYPEGTSQTASACVVSKLNKQLAPIENIATEWANDSILFKFDQTESFVTNIEYTLFRNRMGLQKSNSSPLRLRQRHYAKGDCFIIAYTDNCGNKSLNSQPACPLFAENVTTQPDELFLHWEPYQGYKAGVKEYLVEIHQPGGNLTETISVGLNTSYSLTNLGLADDGTLYRIIAIPEEEGIESSYSNVIEFDLILEGYFPTAFTPNGDGLNDEFKVEGKFVEACRLEIYNRWGELIFITNDKETGWRGEQKSEPAPPGTYTYKATITTIDGKRSIKSGNLLLIRNK